MDETVWSVYDLINEAVIQHNDQRYSGSEREYPTQSHVLLALDADKNGFTAYIVSLFSTFLPGENYVAEMGSTHTPLALTFVKSANGGYELAKYWEPEDGAYYLPSIRSKFPESIWDKVDTQLYFEASQKWCYDQAMCHFFGPIPFQARVAIRPNTYDAVNLTRNVGCRIIEGTSCFLITSFPGATLQFEPYEKVKDRRLIRDPGSWVITYADPEKNITVGGEGTGLIPITDDMIGIYDMEVDSYTMIFEKYVRTEEGYGQRSYLPKPVSASQRELIANLLQ